ncbi:MAG: outer membrane protein TolC [Myxococcota bacterium]|jgi:outer membrane protein TolC
MRSWIILLLGLGIGGVAHAGQPLSLSQALSSANTNNPDVRSVALTIQQADASLLAARATADPTLSMGGDRTVSETQSFLGGFPFESSTESTSGDLSLGGTLSTGTSWSVSSALSHDVSTSTTSLGGVQGEAQTQDFFSGSASLSASQDLLVFFRDTTAQRAIRDATRQQDTARLSAIQSSQQVLVNVASAWWTWQGAFEQAELAQDSLESAITLTERTQIWLEVGQVDETELARVTSDRLQAERNLRASRHEVRRSANALLLMMGEDPGQDVFPVGDGSFALPETYTDAEHLALAQANSIDLALLAIERDGAEADLRDARSDVLPSLALGGQYGRSSLESSAADAIASVGNDSGFPVYGVSLDLSIPIGGRSVKAANQQARAALDSIEIRSDSAEQQLVSSVQLALSSARLAEQDVALASSRLAVSIEVEDGESARVDAGTRRLDQLLDSRQNRQAAQVDLLQAERTLAQAWLELARLEGRVDQVLSF